MCQTLLVSYSLSGFPTILINRIPISLRATMPSLNTSQPPSDPGVSPGRRVVSETRTEVCWRLGKRTSFPSNRRRGFLFLPVCAVAVPPEERQPICDSSGHRLDDESQHDMGSNLRMAKKEKQPGCRMALLSCLPILGFLLVYSLLRETMNLHMFMLLGCSLICICIHY